MGKTLTSCLFCNTNFFKCEVRKRLFMEDGEERRERERDREKEREREREREKL